jgi:hypothetical protein
MESIRSFYNVVGLNQLAKLVIEPTTSDDPNILDLNDINSVESANPLSQRVPNLRVFTAKLFILAGSFHQNCLNCVHFD